MEVASFSGFAKINGVIRGVTMVSSGYTLALPG